MFKGVKTALYLSTCGMVLSGYLALASTEEYGLSTLLIPIAVFALVPLAEWLDTRYRAYRHITTALTYAYTVAIPVLWMSYTLFPTVVALVIYIQAYKLLHRKEEHDYHHIFLMSFFLLVAACVLSPDAAIAVPFLTFLISAVASFFALHVHDEARRCTGSCEADVVPLQLRRPTYGKRREHFVDGSLLASYTAITLACILMTSAFFIATPRMQAGVLGGASLQPIRQFTGLADSVDLSQGGPQELNTSPVMRVYLPDEPEGRFSGDLYWRNTSFDRYNDKGWDNTSEPSRFNDGVQLLRFSTQGGTLDRTSNLDSPRLVRQIVYLDDIPAKGLPTMPLPLRIRWREARLTWDVVKGDTTIDVVAVRRDSLLYEVISEVPQWDPEKLRAASSDYLGTFEGAPVVDDSIYGRLTYHNLSAESVALAERITAPYDNAYDKAVAVERFFSNGEYSYSLRSPQNLRNPADEFIRVTKIGHCELFASAMALMLRSVGIPARV
ncbi:MAG: DUF3488 and transglutaminase-like domain-containing protein, partial [FCB group bacterium]|nr:DUF3488 and transglutaminase-like domain-containing protein [FCB group bacterium]